MTSPPRIWTVEDAQRLTTLREEAGLDASILAKRHSLSIHHIRQLEEGGDDRFYSQAIKLQVGRKLLRSLGGDLVTLPEPADIEVAADPVISVVPEPIHASAVVQDARQSTGLPKSPSRLWVPLGGLVLVAMAWFGWQQAAHNASPQKKTFDPVVEAPKVAPAAEAVAPQSVASAPVSQPDGASVPDVAAPQAVSTEPSTPSLMSQAAAATPVSNSVAPDASAQCNFGADPVRVSVFEPQKPGNYVYFEAQQTVKLCVRDAAKQTTWVELTAGRGRTIRGTAPFEVLSEQFAGVRIFYQGKMVAPGLLTQSHVMLRPQAIVASASQANN
jgi:hypothetical protein